MKKVSHKKLYVRNPDTGEFEPLMAIVGESAYDIAVRLGKFTGTEEEWANMTQNERDAAIQAIQKKGAETLASIPEDYTALVEEVARLEEDKIDKTSIAQELGDSEEKVLSQKAAAEIIENYSGVSYVAVTARDGKYYVKNNGTIEQASGNYHVSEPIPVVAGNRVEFTCTVAGTHISVISLCDANIENIIPVVLGEKDNSKHKYAYDVQVDGHILLSYRYDEEYALCICGENSNIKIKETADSNKTIIKENCGVEKINYTYRNGKYFITSTGDISTAVGSFHISNPIAVEKNDRVVFIATGGDALSLISLCDSDASNIVPKAISHGVASESKYVLDIEQDGHIILSYDYTKRADLYILKDYSNSRLKEAIEETVITSDNLLNHRKLINNKAISVAGVVSNNGQYAITDKIKVEAETAYSYRNIYRIVCFDENDVLLTQTTPPETMGTFTTPANTAYIIACVMKSSSGIGKIYDTTEWQIVKGEVLPDYSQQHKIIDGYRILDTVSSTHDNIAAFRRWDKICFDKEVVVFAKTESDAVTEADESTSAIVGKYDALMNNHGEYITKTAIGTASNGATIYRYDFNVPDANLYGNYPTSRNVKPKIILASGIHPEFGGIYGLYNAMREICENEELTSIKYGVHFIVIPALNPYGIDTHNRKNANGVDLARNFEIDFVQSDDPTSNTYSGTEPLSEPESRILDGVLSENRDAILFASCHSFQLYPNNVIWGSCATMYTSNMVKKLIVKLSSAWRNKYTSEIPQTIDTVLGLCGMSTENGAEGKQAAKYGIQGLTMETSDYFPFNSNSRLTSFAISRNSETYINFIKTVLGCWESSDPKDLNKMMLY